tara:strand:- start:1164 stop:1472 length:309 start_codon:yes stop_codon:yes gene_type:complete
MSISEKDFKEALKDEFGIMKVVMDKGDKIELNPNRKNLQTIYQWGLENPDKFAKSFNKYKIFQKEFLTHLAPVISAIDKNLNQNPYTQGLPSNSMMGVNSFE